MTAHAHSSARRSPTSKACAGLLSVIAIHGVLAEKNLNAEIIQLKPRQGLPPLVMTNAPFEIPNYLPGRKWGTQGEAIHQMQVPLTPRESARHYVNAPGFETKLWAAEPDVAKPIAMAWDERGRLWIAETLDYPNEQQPAGQGRDRIKICEDTDGDGRADRFTVFAEHLSIPTGMCFARGGLIVIEGGHTLFLKDVNGDDRADERKVLFEGWDMGDTHATASNLRYGLDNWIWGTVGYSGFEGEVGGKKVKFSMGVFRFKPDGSALEFIRSSNNNTWGLGQSEEGIIFGSTANNNASWYMAIPNRYYEAVRGWSASRMETIADSQAFYPVTKAVRQVDAHGRYTAGAGHALYTARNYPLDYWNRVAFVTEPTGHLIGQFRLEAKGADFVSRNEGSFLASSDEWAAPIMAEVGPDGQVWMLDWYNYIIQHNPTPQGFKTGKGNAYETPLRDKRHGRIYRVTWYLAKTPSVPSFRGATPEQWVGFLKNDNMLWRLHAQRLLVERGQLDVVEPLVRLVRDRNLDALGLNVGAIHALWTLAGLGPEALRSARSAVEEALSHPSPGVRRNAAAVLPRDADGLRTLLISGVLIDPDAQVQLAALLALAESPADAMAGGAALSSLRRQPPAGDRWLTHAAIAAGARHAEGFLGGATLLSSPVSESESFAIRTVMTHWAQDARLSQALEWIRALEKSASGAAIPFLDGLALGWPVEKKPVLDAGAKAALQAVMHVLPESAQGSLLALAQRWSCLDLFPSEAARIAGVWKATIRDGGAEDSARIDAARRLIALMDSAKDAAWVLSHISAQTPPALASGFLSAVAESRQADTAGAILGVFENLTPAAKRSVVAQLLRRKEWTEALLVGLESGQVPTGDLAAEHWYQLQNREEGDVARRATALQAKRGQASSGDMEATLQKLLPLADSRGDATRGKQVFAAQCAVCHTFGESGGKVGPDLTGIGRRPKRELLAEILDPNRSVEANYRAWTVTMKDGETYTGRLDTETGTTVELLDTTGQKHTLQRREIEQMKGSTLSLMPVGFDQLPKDDLVSLLEYLAQGH